tara:strand:+ start:112 stop:342 length:231 start_codon:yes stop_codon:yes gene_type:complete
MKKITDKDLIVYLVGKGFMIKKSEKDGNRSNVYFKQSKEIDEAILDYVNKADAKYNEFQEAERRVKTLLCLNRNNK